MPATLSLNQVWNAHAEQKKISTGDGYMTSSDRAALVPEAANVLREQGHPEMASILDNTTEGARKVRGGMGLGRSQGRKEGRKEALWLSRHKPVTADTQRLSPSGLQPAREMRFWC